MSVRVVAKGARVKKEEKGGEGSRGLIPTVICPAKSTAHDHEMDFGTKLYPSS